MTRGRKVRFSATAGGTEPAGPVTAIGPIVFTVAFGGTPVTVDLSDLPCPRLVRPLAAALASISGDHGTVRTLIRISGRRSGTCASSPASRPAVWRPSTPGHPGSGT